MYVARKRLPSPFSFPLLRSAETEVGKQFELISEKQKKRSLRPLFYICLHAQPPFFPKNEQCRILKSLGQSEEDEPHNSLSFKTKPFAGKKHLEKGDCVTKHTKQEYHNARSERKTGEPIFETKEKGMESHRSVLSGIESARLYSRLYIAKIIFFRHMANNIRKRMQDSDKSPHINPITSFLSKKKCHKNNKSSGSLTFSVKN